MTELLVTLCTCPDKDSAEKIARLLVENKFAACVNILPNIKSVYTWQGQVECAEEQLLIIKSCATLYQDIEAAIRNRHPYEIPEIIAFPIKHGLAEYIDWVQTCRE